ncbi:oligosaccharide biosynthesis protein Alg14 like-domain-containing protein [Xylariaceae sp. FL0804]|nr:oligosaccharide biosynthesis protein Alg14 like-domain-containing protein [Xylariaceae sp. FL0804]
MSSTMENTKLNEGPPIQEGWDRHLHSPQPIHPRAPHSGKSQNTTSSRKEQLSPDLPSDQPTQDRLHGHIDTAEPQANKTPDRFDEDKMATSAFIKELAKRVVINGVLFIGATYIIAYMMNRLDKENYFLLVLLVMCLLSMWVFYAQALLHRCYTSSEAAMVRSQSHYTFFICGSGGHTAEMIRMIERSIRPEDAAHRRWAIGKGDVMSHNKVLEFEHRLQERFSSTNHHSGTFDIVWFERARLVHQSWLSTPFTALLSIVSIIRILITPPSYRASPAFRFPGVIITNGPGTGFLFLVVARILRMCRVVPRSHMRTLYVESWARTRSLSLTGKLIHRFSVADLFIVQSNKLARNYGVYGQDLV